MKKRLQRALLYTIILFTGLYLADSLAPRYRREPLGSIMVYRTYALHKTRQKTNYMFAEPEAQPCVHALFPHRGHPPCWYLTRHSEQRIDYE